MASEIEIVIIEDDPANRRLLEDVLGIAGYHCLSADNAEAGIQLVKKHNPSIVLMDIKLPDMDGLAAAHLLRKEPELKKTKIIGMSAHAMKAAIDLIDESRFDLFLVKPFSYKVLLEYLSKEYPSAG